MRRAVSLFGVALGVLVLGALLCLERPALVFGQRPDAAGEGHKQDKDKRTISTSGTATVRIKPDSARVFFGVESIARTIKEARGDNAAHVRHVIAALSDLKIPDLRMKTADVQVTLIQHQDTQDKLPQIIGYRVQSSLTVLVQDNDPVKLGAAASRLLDTALESGANSIQHIAFFRKDETDARRRAMTAAVEDALRNARALAAGVHGEVADTVSISGAPQYRFDQRAQMQNSLVPSGGEAGATTLVAGDLEVSCSVNVQCRY
jgi:uncharacterized protein YggE